MENEEKIVEYESEIQYIHISKIEPNKFNPRQRFSEEEEDELIQSIIAKGILNPIVVYKKEGEDKYVILDGERRYRACQKLPNIKELPARILLKEPDKLESLSLMFHIHHVQKDWTEFAISITLIEIIKELKKDVKKLTRQDKMELTKVTSLSEYKINKYLIFQDYPEDVIKRFLKSEVEGKEEPGADPDILLEMYRPIRQIKEIMPEVLKKYSISKIIDSCIKKKAKEIIKTNKEFRFLSKCLTASEKGRIDIRLLKEKIISFIVKTNVTPEAIYKATAKSYYQVNSINKATDNLTNDINDLNLSHVPNTDKNDMKKRLGKLTKIIKSRFNI